MKCWDLVCGDLETFFGIKQCFQYKFLEVFLAYNAQPYQLSFAIGTGSETYSSQF